MKKVWFILGIILISCICSGSALFADGFTKPLWQVPSKTTNAENNNKPSKPIESKTPVNKPTIEELNAIERQTIQTPAPAPKKPAPITKTTPNGEKVFELTASKYNGTNEATCVATWNPYMRELILVIVMPPQLFDVLSIETYKKSLVFEARRYTGNYSFADKVRDDEFDFKDINGFHSMEITSVLKLHN